MKKETFVISVGGSVLVPNGINHDFLKKFTALIKRKVKSGHRFVLVIGGGAPARVYQNALVKASKPSSESLDWMGIAATHLNAQLVRHALGEQIAENHIVTNPEKPGSFTKPVLVSGGWKPGRSTDYEAVMLAHRYKAAQVINMSNIDYVYDKDPRKHKDAKKIELIDWANFQKIVGTKWSPGANVPFDPTATKYAKAHRQRVVILNGKNLDNLNAALSGSGKFKGTVVV